MTITILMDNKSMSKNNGLKLKLVLCHEKVIEKKKKKVIEDLKEQQMDQRETFRNEAPEFQK